MAIPPAAGLRHADGDTTAPVDQDLAEHSGGASLLRLAIERHSLAGELKLIAVTTGDQSFARAARALVQLPPGRPSLDDRFSVDEVEMLIANKIVKSQRAACILVAKARYPGKNPRAVAERLRRKLKAKNSTTE
jgi:hypothetical protein